MELLFITVRKSLRLSSMNLMRWPPLLALYWFACFAATHLSLHQGEEVFPHFDQLVHFGMFGALGFLMALHWSKPKVLLMVTVYAIFDELTQPLVGRDCDILDLLCDFLGGSVGMKLARWWLANFASSVVKPGTSSD